MRESSHVRRLGRLPVCAECGRRLGVGFRGCVRCPDCGWSERQFSLSDCKRL